MSLDKSAKTFVIYIAVLLAILVYYVKKTQIGQLLVAKTFTRVSSQYFNYINVFLPNFTIELLEYIDMNNYTIKLEKNNSPFDRPIYSLGLIELEILKTYIKTHLKTGFI